MIPRNAEAALSRYARSFPAVCITGPRQSGKTTLAKAAFPHKPYLSLEDPDINLLARSDPRGLLENYPQGLILDEAQSAREIFIYLKTAIDKDPVPGKYIITGSRQFDLLENITESLAGRAAFLTLLPFSAGELKKAGLAEEDPHALMIKGLYPPLYDREISPRDWYTAYIQTYIERDLRSLINVKDLGQFQNFLKFCAARTGALVNLSDLALDAGISHNTARAWLSILETSGIVFFLRPYYRNFGKRLVKHPKLYFIDPGLVCRLLGIQTGEQLFLHPHRGNIFETLIISEQLKTRFNRGLAGELYFWRDNTGGEVDLVFEEAGRLRAREIKSGKTFQPEWIKSLTRWQKTSGAPPGDCALIYGGNTEAIYQGIKILPWNREES
jgi:predicted AAA+ superfamily ATPase